MAAITPTRTQAERADHTRARILDAAIRAFSENGLAGARTEQIAEEAGVNKALLYYYFKSKEDLYAAALEQAFEEVRTDSIAVMEMDASAGERLLQMTLNSFDRSFAYPALRTLVQQEMVRLHMGETNRMARLAEKFFRPMWIGIHDILKDGIAAGELIAVDPQQIRYAALGANVFYFLTAPLTKLAFGTDPLEPCELNLRRRAAIEFLGQAIFLDREHGACVAARVLARTPMPEVSAIGGKNPSFCNINRHEPSLKK
jgi:TetR/AcrR family transcriptional regulator